MRIVRSAAWTLLAIFPLTAAVAGTGPSGDWEAHFTAGESLDRAGQYAASAAEFEAALAEAEHFSQSDWRLPATLHNLGAVYGQLGRFSDAGRLLRRAIGIFERWQPERRAERAASLYALGSIYLSAGEFGRAEPLLRASYELRPDGVCLHGLARIAHERRRFAEAEGEYRQAMALLEAAKGAESLAVADVAHNWALLYRDQRRDPEARPLLARAQDIYEHSAPAHPKLAVILRNRAELEAAADNAAEAGALFERSLAICDGALPADHPQTGAILEAYAKFLRQQNRKRDAEVAAARAAAILNAHPHGSWDGYTVDAAALRTGK
jgi:tetratricopeptide (TPR) repeat protein